MYSFDELSDKAKEVAIENERNDEFGLTYGNWWQNVYDTWEEKLNAEGYKDVTIQFSGFYSQGDGANFTASVDIQKWLEVAKKKGKYQALYKFAKQYDIPMSIVRTFAWHSEHENTVNIDTADDYTMSEKAQDQLTEIESLILEEARGYMRDIYRDLRNEYEYLTSDENIEAYLSDEFSGDRYYTKEGEREISL